MGGFIENLAGRAAGNPPPVVIRPAMSPEMLPDAFSEGSVVPMMPAVKPEPARREAPASARHPVEKTPAPVAKPNLAPARENNGAGPERRAEEASPAPPAESRVWHAVPAPQSRPPAKNKEPVLEPANSLQGVTKRAGEAGAHRDIGDRPTPAKPVAPGYSAKEAPHEGKPEYSAVDNSAAVDERRIAPVPTPKAEGSKEMLGARTAKNAPAVKPDARSVEGRASTEAPPGLPRTGPVQQGRALARPAKQAQVQAHRQGEETVTVNIGRIEVRALFPQKQAPSAKEQNGMSLSEYLKLRAERKL